MYYSPTHTVMYISLHSFGLTTVLNTDLTLQDFHFIESTQQIYVIFGRDY